MTDKPEELPVIFRAERSGDFKGIPPSRCGTAIWFTDGSKVLMTETPYILAK